MLELQSPILTPSPTAIRPDAALRLSQQAPGAIWQIAGWGEFGEAAAPALQALGFEGLGDFRTARKAGEAEGLRIAPDKLLLRHPDPNALKSAISALDPSCAASLDLSHARWSILVAGPAVEDLLARLTTIDVSLRAFPVGNFAQTGIHHVGVMLFRRAEDAFEILVPYTWAMSIWAFIRDCAKPFAFCINDGGA